MIRKVEQLLPKHYALLLSADPNKQLIDEYVHRGSCFEMRSNTKETVGIMVLLATRPETIEIVNLAVAEQYQGQGIAQKLICFALEYSKQKQFKTIEIGTGSTGFKQLYLYQKCGFRMISIDRDFFTRHYNEAIIENNLALKDMVRLSLDL